MDATGVGRPKGFPPGGSNHPAAFVGRERELAELRAGLDDAVSGRGRLYLLDGHPGVGKSRLAEEFAREAERLGTRVQWGRCWEEGGAPAYWPWVQIIRSHARSSTRAELVADLGPAAAVVARIVPRLAEWLPESGGPPEPALLEEQGRFPLFDAVAGFLRRASQRHPLVLILDDLHAADRPSLALLQFVARAMADSRILALGTYRTVEMRRAGGLAEIFGELGKEGRNLSLAGLSEAETALFVERLSGVSPSSALRAAVYRTTEGNPLFTDEVVRLLVAEGRFERAPRAEGWAPALPGRLREAIRRHAAPLSDECRRILSVASVVGREFSLAHLERLLDVPVLRLLEVLGDAIALEVIGSVADAPGRYRFAHALIQETLYEDLPFVRRIELHRRVAETLEQLSGADLDSDLAALARHYFEAARAGHAGKAIDYCQRCGKRSMRLLAWEEAAENFERALQALDLERSGDDESRCELLLSLAEAQWKSGESSKVRETAERAVAAARRIGAPQMLARAAVCFAIGLQGYEGYGPTGKVDATLVALLRKALAGLPADDTRLRADLLGRLAVALYWSDEADECETLSAEAVALARVSGDARTLSAALINRRFAHWGPDGVEERLAAATEVLRLAEKGGDRERVLTAHQWRLMDFLELGDVLGASAEMEAHARIAAELRQPIYVAYSSLFGALRSTLEGRFTEGEALAGEALRLGQEAQNPAATELFGAQIFWSRWLEGRVAEFEGVVPFLEQFRAMPAARGALALIHAETGRDAEARAELERLAAGDFTELRRDVAWLVAMAILAEVSVRLEHPAVAALLYAKLQPYAGRNIVVGPPPNSCYGPVDLYLGEIAALLGRVDEAQRHFEHALKIASVMSAWPLVVRTRYAAAAMLAAHGRVDRAREVLGTAPEVAGRLGMEAIATRSRVLASRLGAEPSTSATPGPPPPAANLFLREGDYWTIEFQGRQGRVRDSKGLRYLARLLVRPGDELHVVDLAADQDPDTIGGRQGAAEITGSGAGGGPRDAGDLLDSHARRQYRDRLEELESELAKASTWNDRAREETLRREVEFLRRELAAAFGLGGRARKGADDAERLRKAVCNRLRDAVSRIGEVLPELGTHLESSVRMGSFCVYRPDHPCAWEQ